MKIFDILNVQSLLNESVLSTSFTFGFELEGICTEGDGSGLPGYHSEREATGYPKKLKNKLEKLLGFGKGKIERDGSLYSSPDKGGWPFEWASPVIPFNPRNLQKFIHFLYNLNTLNVYTNTSCGFHTHLSFPDIDKKTAVWVICCLAIDESLKKEFSLLETDDMTVEFTGEYAEKKYLEKIKNELNITNPDYRDVERIINGYYDNYKYRLFKIHEQGTLEWRGPRNFLNTENKTLILEFIKKLYRIVVKLGHIIDARTYESDGIKINREDIEKNIKLSNNFDSPKENKNKSKSEKLLSVIIQNPLVITALKPNQINALFEENADEVLYKLKQTEPKVVVDIFNSMSDKIKLNIFKILKSNDILKGYFNLFSSLYESGTGTINLPKEITMDILKENYIELLYNNKDVDYDAIIKYMNKNYMTKGLLKFFIYKAKELPYDVWKYLLKLQYIQQFQYFNYIPTKIQKMIIRKSPYFIQYIRNPDESVVAEIKKKLPNFDVDQFIPRI